MTDTPRATGNDLKHAILDEARRVLVEQGYTGLSTRRLAAAVGCTATSIYLYFKSKDTLIHALIEEGFEELHGRMMAAVEDPGTPRERLERAAHAYIRFGLEETPYYEIMFMLRAEQMERFPAESYRRARATLDSFATVAGMPAKEGLLAGTAVWSSLHGVVTLIIAGRVDNQIDRDQLIQHTVQATCTAALGGGSPSSTPHTAPPAPSKP